MTSSTTRTKDVQLYGGVTGLQSLTNAGKAKETGVELDANWTFTRYWRAKINGTIDTPIGVLMPRVAISVVGKHYFDGDNAVEQGSYATTNLRLVLLAGNAQRADCHLGGYPLR